MQGTFELATIKYFPLFTIQRRAGIDLLHLKLGICSALVTSMIGAVERFRNAYFNQTKTI